MKRLDSLIWLFSFLFVTLAIEAGYISLLVEEARDNLAFYQDALPSQQIETARLYNRFLSVCCGIAPSTYDIPPESQD